MQMLKDTSVYNYVNYAPLVFGDEYLQLWSVYTSVMIDTFLLYNHSVNV